MTENPVGGFDVICNPETFDGRAYMYNMVFDSFKTTYPSNPVCGNNKVFVTHPIASDMTAGHYLFGVNCTNCDADAKVYFRNPSPGWLGWFGGCGNFLCTGPNNVLIHDYNGTFFGFGFPA